MTRVKIPELDQCIVYDNRLTLATAGVGRGSAVTVTITTVVILW